MVSVQQFAVGVTEGAVPAGAGFRGAAYHKGMIDPFQFKLGFDQSAQLNHTLQIAGVLILAFEHDHDIGFQLSFAHDGTAYTR